MKRLFSHLKPYVLECILGPLFKLLEATLELIVPLIIANIIDNGIAMGDTQYVSIRSLHLVFHGLAGLSCALIAQFFAARAAVGFTCGLKHTLFFHIQSLSAPDVDRIGTATMVTRLTGDMDRLQSGVNLTLRLLLRSPFVVFGAMIMAFTVSPESAWIFLTVILLLSIVVFGIMLITMPLYKKVQGQTDTVLSHVRENLTGARVMRAFCREEKEISAFDLESQHLTALQKYTDKISALMNPLTYVIINLAIVILLQFGAIRVNTGELSCGQVVALYNYLSLILTELIKMANMIISLTKAIACAKRIGQALDEPISILDPESDPAEDPLAPAVEFKNVSVKYDKAAENSLCSVSFTANRGEIIGIIGGTGSGKSTLVNLINRGYDATEGEVLVNGVNVRSYPLKALREKIGIVPQTPTLFRGTVRENLRIGNADATDEEMREAIRYAQAENFLLSSDEGLDKPLTQGGKNLSGGQRQRLTIARALVRRPEILILDDSASSLDNETARRLHRVIANLPYRPTVLLVSQRAAALRFADRILVLEEGALVGCGKHEDLCSHCEVYREIYESQFSEEAKKQ